MRRLCGFFALVLWIAFPFSAGAADASLREQAGQTLRKAVGFFREHVATEGGYLWRYSEDLARREGEGRASHQTVWVQPPGTPSVGLAFLRAYDATGDPYYLDAAKQAGYCLVRGQLRSGGWAYKIEFDPKERRRYAYRVDTASKGGRNVTTLDDNNTQAALRLLMRLDQIFYFKDPSIHEAAEYGLASLLNAQYPNGAWPQRYEEFPDPKRFPVLKAGYPESWPRTFPRKNYRNYYTFNDNAMSDVIDVLFEAGRTYGQEKYTAAARRGGDFILSAQMPEPQPAWAQQYDLDMHPAWARKFEPPSVTGGESQGIMWTLLRIYRETGDRKYLEPVPTAIAYLRKSLLPNGRLARFYELKTNKPLYFTKKYELTYNDNDMPTHYAFKVGNGIDRIEREYKRVLGLKPEQLRPPAWPPVQTSRQQIARVESVVAALDDQGRWVEDGRLKYHGSNDPARRVIDCRTFSRNVKTLSDYLAKGTSYIALRLKERPRPKPRKVKEDPAAAKARAYNRRAAELYRSAQAAERAGTEDAARGLYERIIKQYPDSPPAEKARAWLSAAKARAYDEKAAKLYRSATRAERAGMDDLARRLYERLIREHPDSPLAEKAKAKK